MPSTCGVFCHPSSHHTGERLAGPDDRPDAKSVATSGGATRPLKGNCTADHRARNRRARHRSSFGSVTHRPRRSRPSAPWATAGRPQRSSIRERARFHETHDSSRRPTQAFLRTPPKARPASKPETPRSVSLSAGACPKVTGRAVRAPSATLRFATARSAR
jgi:hypothetical protein